MQRAIVIELRGIPQPGGSKKAFKHPTTGRIVVTDDGKYNKEWRHDVSVAGVIAMKAEERIDGGPVYVDVTFYMPRPKSHYNSKGLLKPNAPIYHTVRPDGTKLWRSTEDALTGIAWKDDGQVAWHQVRKLYGATPGAYIEVNRLNQQGETRGIANTKESTNNG